MAYVLISVFGGRKFKTLKSAFLATSLVVVNSIVELAATTQYLHYYANIAAKVSLVVRFDAYMYGACIALSAIYVFTNSNGR